MSEYGILCSLFPVFGLNSEKYGPLKTLHLDTCTQWKLEKWPKNLDHSNPYQNTQRIDVIKNQGTNSLSLSLCCKFLQDTLNKKALIRQPIIPTDKTIKGFVKKYPKLFKTIFRKAIYGGEESH